MRCPLAGLTVAELQRIGCFTDPTERISFEDFNWYWDFEDNQHASISRRFCGVFILGYKKKANTENLDKPLERLPK